MFDASTTPAVRNASMGDDEPKPKPDFDYYEAVCMICPARVTFSATPKRAQLLAMAGVRCAQCRGVVEIRQDIDMRTGSVLMSEGRRE